jgi:hypothetical protein
VRRARRRTGGWFQPEDVAVMSKFLVTIGAVILVVGLLWPWLSRLGLGRLPGDILIERGNSRFYFPITTSIVVSIVLSLILWFFKR